METIGIQLHYKTILSNIDLEMKTWHQIYSGKYFKKSFFLLLLEDYI